MTAVAHDPQHWLLVATDRSSPAGRRYSAVEIFRLRCQDRFWGCGAATPYRHRLRPGDGAIFYLGGSGGQLAVGSARFTSGLVQLSAEERLRLRHGDEGLDMAAGVYLEEVSVWPRPVTFSPEVRAQLGFIGDKVRWGSALQGTFIPITAEDYAHLRMRGGLVRELEGAVMPQSRGNPRAAQSPLMPQPPLAPAPPSPEGILLGHAFDSHAPVFWDPVAEKNPHLLVVGLSGAGKTETLRTIVHELRQRQVPALIFDRHDEFGSVAESCIDLGADVALNPLELLGRRPSFVAYEILQILEQSLQLGAQQRALLRSAIQRAYRKRGIDDKVRASWDFAPPTFAEVREQLDSLATERQLRSIVARLTNRLDFLLDLDVFGERTHVPFNLLLRHTTAIRFAALPGGAAKDVVTEFVLRRLWEYVSSQGQTPALRLFTVLDEAHRLAYEGSALEPFLREARKYGLGMLLASQRPPDFAETILANVATVVALQCTYIKDARFVAQHINCGPGEVQNLTERGEALVKFASEPYPHHTQIWPAFARAHGAA